jgi:HK97 family phage prohead protease
MQSYAGSYQTDNEQEIGGVLEAIRLSMGTPVHAPDASQKSTGYDYKAAPEKPHLEKNTLYGYAAWHRDTSGNEYVDSYGDVTTPGSWQACIHQWEKERQDTGRSWLIPHLYNHSKNDHVGAVMLLREDTRGVYYESRLASTSRAQEVKALASDGMLQCSYGYIPEEVEYITNSKTGRKNRRLRKVFVHEISALSGFAANPYASARLKSREIASQNATDALQAVYRSKLGFGILRLGNMTVASLIAELERIAHG